MFPRVVSACVGIAFAIALVLTVAAGPVVAAPPMAKNFVAVLSGGEEVPAVDTNARGLAKFQLSADGTEMSFKLIVANIKGVAQAHIHCGPAGENGPVVVFLFGFVQGGVDFNGVLSEGTFSEENIIGRPANDICPGGLSTFADLLRHIGNGNAYVNAHTVENPGGEIRGQMMVAGPSK